MSGIWGKWCDDRSGILYHGQILETDSCTAEFGIVFETTTLDFEMIELGTDKTLRLSTITSKSFVLIITIEKLLVISVELS